MVINLDKVLYFRIIIVSRITTKVVVYQPTVISLSDGGVMFGNLRKISKMKKYLP